MAEPFTISTWEHVRESQADAAAAIRELHDEMDQEVRHERRSAITRVDVVTSTPEPETFVAAG